MCAYNFVYVYHVLRYERSWLIMVCLVAVLFIYFFYISGNNFSITLN